MDELTYALLSKKIDNLVKENPDYNGDSNVIVFSKHYEFPNVGEAGALYIAVDENAIYRYDELGGVYVAVGRDYSEIDAVQGVL